MNHLPYEEWLLSGEELTTEQQVELQDHLQGCEACKQLSQAWQSVASAIHSTPEMTPTPGFTQRWQARLFERRAQRQRRQTWTILLICVVAALTTLGALALPSVGGLPSWVELLSSLLRSFSQLATTFMDVRDVATQILRYIPLGIPFLLWVVLSTTLVIWSLAWMLMIWRLPKYRRSQNEAHN